MASFRQDLYFNVQQRVHALRLGPYDEASARLLVHPDHGTPLGSAALNAFLEYLADRVEVVCLDPTAPADPRSSDRPAILRACLSTIDVRWPRRLPIVLVGHGNGGTLALTLADSAQIRGVVALAPAIEILSEAEQLDLASGIDAACVPLLAVFMNAESGSPVCAALERHPRATLIRFPGQVSALTRPIATFVAEWSLEVVNA
jgi:pimeloyl-ACP methyl ester carboxylesterase